ncbi:hypothetical protein ACM66B_000514 [Microbotryomycetes sp. NB124-2]
MSPHDAHGASGNILDSPPPQTLHAKLPPSPPECRITSPLYLPPPLAAPETVSIHDEQNENDDTSRHVDDSDLFLAIDSSMKKMRACLVDKCLKVVCVEQVELDTELSEFGTHNGVYTVGSEVRAPSEQRVAALDLLLTKLAFLDPESSILARVRAVSGACHSNAVFLSHDFSNLLEFMNHAPEIPLQDILVSSRGFSEPLPRTQPDGSVKCVFSQAFDDVASTVDMEQVLPFDLNETSASSSGTIFDTTGHMMLESTFMSSLMLGAIAPVDSSDMCSTGLIDLDTADWNEQRVRETLCPKFNTPDDLDAVMSRLGHVQLDGPASLGNVSDYFVKRYGFHPSCLVVPFSGDHSSSFLAYDLSGQDVALCLGVGLSDTLMARTSVSSSCSNIGEDAHVLVSPVAPHDQNQRIVVISNKNASVARSLVRDVNCNGSWPVFARLAALVPHGGTVGLDNKYFSIFLPSNENEQEVEGFQRFVSGSRVQDFSDRKVNPRLLIESQLMSLSSKLSSFKELERSQETLAPSNSTGRLILHGGAAQNPAIVALSATVFNKQAYFVNETTEMAQTSMETCQCRQTTSADHTTLTTRVEQSFGHSYKSTTSALGAAYKAAYSFALQNGWPQSLLSSDEIRKLGFWGFVKLVRRNASDVVCQCADKSCISRPVSSGGDDENVDEGLTLVANPDKDEHRYYTAMLPELVRLEKAARKGLV